MICNVCGKEYQDGNAFCPYCGSKTAAPGSQPQMIYGASQGGQQYGSMQQGQGQQYTGQVQGQQFGGPGQGQQYGGPANGQQYGGQGQPQQFGGAGQPYGQPQFYNGPMQQEPPKKKKSHKGAIIAILLVIVLIGCGVGGFFGYKWYRNNCLENALADGEEQYADGNYDKAISFYKEALKYDEENKQALDGIKKSELGNALADAKALCDKGSYDEAIAAYDKILEDYPDNEDATKGKSDTKKAKLQAQIAADLEVANGYLDSKDYENAITAYETVLKEDSGNEEAKSGIVTAYNAIIDADIAASDYETAMEDAQKALKATGDDSFQTRMDDEISPNLIPDVDDALEAADDYLMDATSLSASINNTIEFSMTMSSGTYDFDGEINASFKGTYDDDSIDQAYTSLEYYIDDNEGDSLVGHHSEEIFCDGKTFSSNYDDGGWEADTDDNQYSYYGIMLSDSILFDVDMISDCTIDDTTTEIDGRQCFVIRGTFGAGDADTLAMYAEFFYGLGIGDDVDSVTADVVLYLDAETFAPVRQEIELDGLDMSHFASDISEALEEDGIKITDATCKFTITYDSYEDVGDLTPSDY